MATQITFEKIGGDMVSATPIDDWNTPTLQLFITKANTKNKAFITIKAAVKDDADDSYAVVYSAQCSTGTYVFKVNNTTDGVNYKIVCENCSAAEGYYLND